jgi:pyrroline-5-carboxylate reductase
MSYPKISFIGAGNMADAIIHGLLKQAFPKENLCIANRSQKKLESFNLQGLHTTTDNNEAAEIADLIVLAVKPNQLEAVCQALSPSIQKPIIVSVAAGISADAIGSWLNYSGPIVRAMPNTGSALGLGATGLFCSSELNQQQRERVNHIFNSIGISAWLKKESLINSVAALSGSGAAYYLQMMQVMQQEAVAMGLEPKIASQFCTQTVLGAAELAKQNQDDYQTLREQITSPGGSTFATLEALRENSFAESLQKAMQAAVIRSEAMAKEN